MTTKTQRVEQIKVCLQAGDYARALDLLRGAAAEFPSDSELAELQTVAQDGVKNKAEADRLITKSQELFAQQKSSEAIQLLCEAYKLDKNNSLARAILANSLVEHAHSLVETNWLEAEALAKQALDVNPAHPTAKTILNLIVEQKKVSSVEDWVSQAHKLQSSGDLFGALAWVAEGLAVHPSDPKLLQIQDQIQRDQGARRRQTRRHDLENLRRIELEIDEAADGAAKQALAERIQGVAAKYWTDGEFLSVANSLLHRLGLVPEGSTGSPQSKGAAVIFHVPRAAPPKPSRAESHEAVPGKIVSSPAPAEKAPTPTVPPSHIPTTPAGNVSHEVITIPAEQPPAPPQTAIVPAVEPSTVVNKRASGPAQPKQPTSWSSSTLMLVSAGAAVLVVAAIYFSAQKPQAPAAAETPTVTPAAPVPAVSAPVASSPVLSASNVAAAPQAVLEPSRPASPVSPDSGRAATAHDNQPTSGRNSGTLVVVAGQDEAQVFLNGKVQPQLTQGGQLRLPNLPLNNYAVQVSKSGFQNPSPQQVRIRKGEEAHLTFSLQPQPRLSLLTIEGGIPGTTVLIDQTALGAIQPDGRLSVSSITPGDHSVELRKERFRPRQFKKHFVAGETISLAAADAVLEAAPGQLKITFSPADAKVAVVKGSLLRIISSGVPLDLAAGTYTLTARTTDGYSSSAPLEVAAGQSKSLDLSLSPNGMSKWEDSRAWKPEKDYFVRKGGDFVLYGVVPASGNFVFSAMLAKGHKLQWVFNYADPNNYVLFQMDDNTFYRAVIRNGERTDEVRVPEKSDKKHFSMFHVRVSSGELVHQVRHGDSWTVLDRLTQPGMNLCSGKFGFYIPADDQVALSGFAHYADLNLH